MILMFDLSEVLVHGMYDMHEVLRHRFGQTLADMAVKRHDECYKTLMLDWARGLLTEDEYWAKFMEGVDWPEGITARVFKSALSENLKRRVNGTDAVLKRIVGYTECPRNPEVINGRPPMILLSDNFRERIPELEAGHPDIFGLFDRTVWSCDYGMIKTDPGFFPQVVADLEVDPEDIIFIDDSGPNLQAARNAGITKTIKFVSASLLEIALESIGIIFDRKATPQSCLKTAVAT